MAVNMDGVACRGMRCVGGWENVQRCRDGYPQRHCGVVPRLVAFLGFHPYMPFYYYPTHMR